uniref:Protein kinase domain-containing protein n=1 Tax=viral metagenome TaxID=1070528 RepID=A0A6C0JB37_9ZZZZ
MKIDYLSDRLLTGTQIETELYNLDILYKWENNCLSEPENNFVDFKNVELLGRGSFGQVFSVLFNKFDLAIKESKLTIKERNALKKNISYNSFPEEYKILYWIKTLIEENICPNFIYTYGFSLCDNCKILTLGGLIKKNYCYLTFMEKASTELSHANIVDYKHQLSILQQILMGISSMQKYFSLSHDDIKKENILLKKVSNLKGTYIQYFLDDKEYLIENPGWIVLISDFGVSRSFSPKYSLDGYFGERNAKIVSGQFKPIISDSYLSKNDKTKKFTRLKPYKFKWINSEGTKNRVYKGQKNNFDTPVDLFDTQKFPPFEFFNDVQDALRIFIGGKRLCQPDVHEPLNISSKLIKQIHQILPEKMNKLYSTNFKLDSTHLFLANKLVEKLYTKPKNGVTISNTFYI